MEDTVLNERVEAGMADPDSNIPSMSLLDLVLNSLESNKAEDIVELDLRGRSSVADYMIVASGRSSRQVVGLAEKLTDRIKEATGELCKLEGKANGDWVLVDCGSIIVHLFRPEVREFYQLEKLWQPVADGDA